MEYFGESLAEDVRTFLLTPNHLTPHKREAVAHILSSRFPGQDWATLTETLGSVMGNFYGKSPEEYIVPINCETTRALARTFDIHDAEVAEAMKEKLRQGDE